MPDVKEKDSGFSPSDFDLIATQIVDEFRKRERKRRDLEKVWKEIDRQLRMSPDVKYKKTADGTKIRAKTWMPEMELPLQSQALEVLTSDCRSMIFPDYGDMFCVKSNADQEFLKQFIDNVDVVVNDTVDLPSVITQENIDDYCLGWTEYVLDQFDHQKSWDLILTDAIKYGVGVGRARLAKKPQFLHDARGTFDNTRDIPVLAPVSIKNVYLDESTNDLMADGAYISPATIFRSFKKPEDLQLAAKKGGKDAKDENGGWMPANLEGLEGDKNGQVEYIEYEGDLIVPKSDATLYIPNVVATVVIGTSNQKPSAKLARLRLRKYARSSYIQVPYQRENIDSAYSTSPLMKGAPIQRAASEALNRYMQAAILNTEPVVQYSRDDAFLKSKGGCPIYPGAQWPSDGDIKIHEIGDPAALQGGYTALLAQYADVTGMNAPRLGASTVSHTTAYAKNQEIQRGQSRTVDFVASVLEGPMTQWLYMHWQMARDALGKDTETVYMDKFGSFVKVTKDHLPEQVNFKVYGSAGPQDNAAEMQKKAQALQMVIQIDAAAAPQGLTKPLNYDNVKREILKNGGFQDVDAFMLEGTPGQPAVQGTAQGNGGAGVAPIALQDAALLARSAG